MRCDIIIPTFNSAAVLPHTVAALTTQAVPPGWELRMIWSDDGSTDATVDQLRALPLPRGWSQVVLTHPHGGPAAARNHALGVATADVLLLLGADILLRPGALAAHLVFHQRDARPLSAALGFVQWDPRVRPTPLMLWTTHGGPQNDYDSLLGRERVEPSHYCYGSHLSIKRAALAHECFAATFTAYGWEDLELGRRLQAQGLTLSVLHAAHALHRHHYSATALCRRQELVGAGLVQYQRLYPGVTLLPARTRTRRVKYGLATAMGAAWWAPQLLTRLGGRWTLPRLFHAVTDYFFWRGVFRAATFPH